MSETVMVYRRALAFLSNYKPAQNLQGSNPHRGIYLLPKGQEQLTHQMMRSNCFVMITLHQIKSVEGGCFTVKRVSIDHATPLITHEVLLFILSLTIRLVPVKLSDMMLTGFTTYDLNGFLVCSKKCTLNACCRPDS